MAALFMSLLGSLRYAFAPVRSWRSKTSPFANSWPIYGTCRDGPASAWQTAPSGSFSRACGRAGRTYLSSSSQIP